jgi:two-component sensor histidine kinase
MALAFHELATNAAKYGALSVPGGRVAIGWTITSESQDLPGLRLTWEESGGPPVTAPASTGFGARLIQRGLAAELDGTARIAFPVTGVVCTIEAPL